MKRLIICCDGTWNTPDQVHEGTPNPTNVVKFARAVRAQDDDGVHQIVFYDKGVGTGRGLDRITGGAFGTGLNDNIVDAYRFLVHNHRTGDEIYLIGYSRGAYTVRSVAGMLGRVGLLPKRHADKISLAYHHYKRKIHVLGDKELSDFRDEHGSHDEVPVHFLGVWDTVGALGVPLRGLRFLTRKKHQFHDTDLGEGVHHAYHALAIDERRAPFKPTLWTNPLAAHQTVEQVWFAGVHGSVGGGQPSAELSDVALRWLISHAAHCGLAFDEAWLTAHVQPDPHGPIRNSKTGLYRLTRGITRRIGRSGDTTQSVHPAVVHRTDARADYRPKNLMRFLDGFLRRIAQVNHPWGGPAGTTPTPARQPGSALANDDVVAT
ncbi:MAG: DUF2235 domain-containing protein [Acidobacteriota bacterium]